MFNVVICFVFLLGYVCFRHPESGSRYVKSIVKVFTDKACDTDIRIMLEQVCVLTIIKVCFDTDGWTLR